MESNYIVITADDKTELELECGPDGRYLVESLVALVGNTAAVGLTYTSASSSRQRGVTVKNGELLPPSDGWQTSANRKYNVVFGNVTREPKKNGITEAKILPTPTVEKVKIFLDNSNFWIGAKHYMGEMNQLKCEEDHRIRTEFGKLLKFTAKGIKNAHATLYGSEPPASDSVWKMAESEGWTIILSHKNCKGKEKQVDTKMVADIVETVCTESPGTMILITGDSDFVCAINKSKEKNWKVEVYGWSKSMSEEIKQLQDDTNVKVECLDAAAGEFLVTELQFDLNLMKGNGSLSLNGIVLDVGKYGEKMENYEMEKYCNELTTILRYPVQYHWLDRRNVAILLRGSEKDTCYVNEEVLKIVSDIKCDFVNKVMPFSQYLHKPNALVEGLEPQSRPQAPVPCDKGDDDQEAKEEEIVFTPVKRKQRPKYQKYSENCKYKFNCPRGGKCEYKHTDEESSFFKKHGKAMPHRKTKLCTRPNCKRKKEDCLDAHGEDDAWCSICLKNGHFMDEGRCKKSK